MDKKELKRQYKERKATMGIFKILNTKNQRVLIDGHTDINARMNRHKAQLRFGSHRNTQLQEDWNKYGKDNFLFEQISELKYEENKNDYSKDIDALLEMHIEDLQPFGLKGYH